MGHEKIIKNTGPKYSEMLIELVNEFENELPNKLTFEDTLEIGIIAWNLANKKNIFKNKVFYEDELKKHKNHLIIDKMVNYKLEKLSVFNNEIIDYSTENNILQVKTQTQEYHLMKTLGNILSKIKKK